MNRKTVLCLAVVCAGLAATVLRALHTPDSPCESVEPVPAGEQSLSADFIHGAGRVVPEDGLAFREPEPADPGQTDVDVVVEQQDGYAIEYRKRELMLKFAKGMDGEGVGKLLGQHNLEPVGTGGGLAKLGYVKVRIPEDGDLKETIARLHEDGSGLVTLAEPNFMVSALGAEDPLLVDQWHVQAATFDRAWEVLGNTGAVVVAVVDTGVESGHPDLIGRCLAGYNVVTGNEDSADDHGHGTFVSGIIAASWNDAGGRGLCPAARILPVKALDATGSGAYENVAEAIVYAADRGAEVINLSLGGYAYSHVLHDAVDYALGRGAILVAGGGNDGLEREIYPAALLGVVGVGSTGVDGEILPSSNTGGHVACVAPGENILSTGLDGQYATQSGSSASAAIVSSLAALLVPERASSAASLRRSILETARDLGEAGTDRIYGAGLVDAYAAAGWGEEAFHDVAVAGVSFGSMVFRKDAQAEVQVTLRNLGSYEKETCRVILYEGEGDARRQVARRNHVPVRDSKTVRFEWNAGGLQNGMWMRISAEVVAEGDACSENNVKYAKTVSVVEQGDMVVLHEIEPPVHQWIA
ncbi:MAG: S8 family serine peptidase, partial [Verrucomicrobiota bacterium]|nr:S8 family serine peptidase [Verrucomicrobiota bacterium]